MCLDAQLISMSNPTRYDFKPQGGIESCRCQLRLLSYFSSGLQQNWGCRLRFVDGLPVKIAMFLRFEIVAILRSAQRLHSGPIHPSRGEVQAQPPRRGLSRATALAKFDCHWTLFGLVAYCGVSVRGVSISILWSCAWHDVSVQGPAKS